MLLGIPYILAPGRITLGTIQALLSQTSITAIFAWGTLFSLRSGTMDLAIGSKFLMAMLLVVGFSSCRKGEEPLGPGVSQVAPAGGQGGFFLLNEGNMGSNSVSLDFFDSASGNYLRNIFPATPMSHANWATWATT